MHFPCQDGDANGMHGFVMFATCKQDGSSMIALYHVCFFNVNYAGIIIIIIINLFLYSAVSFLSSKRFT